MIKGRKFWASSYIIIHGGKTIYIKDNLDTFLEQYWDRGCDQIICRVANFWKKEVISIAKKDIYYYGRIFY